MKIVNTIILSAVLGLSAMAQETVINKENINKIDTAKQKADAKPFYQGEILELANAGGYTYILVKEKKQNNDKTELKSFWIAVTLTEAKVGDYIRFQKELVMKNFKSKLLKKTFDEVMFASNLEYRVSK